MKTKITKLYGYRRDRWAKEILGSLTIVLRSKKAVFIATKDKVWKSSKDGRRN